MKNFYTHLVEVESLVVELDQMDLTDDEKIHLASLIDSNLHHTILDAVLSELPEEEKEKFMQALAEDDHQKIWDHLNSKVDNIEEKIKKAAEDLKRELHEDIKESQKLKGKS